MQHIPILKCTNEVYIGDLPSSPRERERGSCQSANNPCSFANPFHQHHFSYLFIQVPMFSRQDAMENWLTHEPR
ncbi:hypothetical protein BLOT_003838 [Blomia tropicalis]|nr:hypothetical protein BLOT_003838 [Blomia tropicalis]